MKMDEAVALLKMWREDNERRSFNIIQLWDDIENAMLRKGSERLKIVDQVITAALDCNRLEIVKSCLQELSNMFPNSVRVEKFRAMQLELSENYEDSLQFINTAATRDEANPTLQKRKIALFKASGQTSSVILELCDYLQKFMSDQEAWHQLCFLYMEEGVYDKAVFCIEDLLLHNPFNYLMHHRLAEIRYTMGGLENIELAKCYYLYAIKLNPRSIRSYYGLYMCCLHIATSKGSFLRRKDSLTLGRWALAQLQEKVGRSIKLKSNYVKVLNIALSSVDLRK